MKETTLAGNNPYLVRILDIGLPGLASVCIGHEEGGTSDEVWLSPQQALDLLKWLFANQETIEKLASEKSENDYHSHDLLALGAKYDVSYGELPSLIRFKVGCVLCKEGTIEAEWEKGTPGPHQGKCSKCENSFTIETNL